MILEVEDLRVEFPTRRGALVAVDGVSFSIAAGEVLGVVGESGAGKSITGLAVIGLLEPPGRIAAGEVRLEGRRIDNLPHEEMRRIRGRRIGMVFQDPLTSLNPLYTVGRQLEETILTHFELGRDEARRRALRLLGEVGIPAAHSRFSSVMICAWIETSSAVVGSSAMISRGSAHRASAITTRWRMPPENWCG